MTDQAPGSWEKDLDQLIFKGSLLIEEAVFFHKESRTLILTDLIENFDTDYTESKLLKTVQKLGKITAPKGSTPIDYRLTFWDKKHKLGDLLKQFYLGNQSRLLLAMVKSLNHMQSTI